MPATASGPDRYRPAPPPCKIAKFHEAENDAADNK